MKMAVFKRKKGTQTITIDKNYSNRIVAFQGDGKMEKILYNSVPFSSLLIPS
jgi:hypothetical protein